MPACLLPQKLACYLPKARTFSPESSHVILQKPACFPPKPRGFSLICPGLLPAKVPACWQSRASFLAVGAVWRDKVQRAGKKNGGAKPLRLCQFKNECMIESSLQIYDIQKAMSSFWGTFSLPVLKKVEFTVSFRRLCGGGIHAQHDAGEAAGGFGADVFGIHAA